MNLSGCGPGIAQETEGDETGGPQSPERRPGPTPGVIRSRHRRWRRLCLGGHPFAIRSGGAESRLRRIHEDGHVAVRVPVLQHELVTLRDVVEAVGPR